MTQLPATTDRELPAPVGKSLPATQEDSQRLEKMLSARGMSKQDYQVLRNVIFPTAKTETAVLLAVDYCRARKLDIMNKPVHVVPSYVDGQKVETVWPGIGLHRITAQRTGELAGQDECKFGPMVTQTWQGTKKINGKPTVVDVKVTYPEWAQITVYRYSKTGEKAPYPGPKTYWLENYKTIDYFSDCPNDRWAKAPIGQLEKCAEAAALRRAFPEECSSQTAEEMEDAVLQGEVDETGKVTIKAINNTIEEFAQELASANAADEATEVQPTSQEKMQAAAKVAEKVGDSKAAEALQNAASAGITSQQAMQLMKLAKPKGWTTATIVAEIVAQYPDIDAKKWQQTMTERQWQEMCDFVESWSPDEARNIRECRDTTPESTDETVEVEVSEGDSTEAEAE